MYFFEKNVIALLSVLLFSSCFVTKSVASTTKESGTDINSIIQNMTVEEKVTQLLMPDFRNWKQESETKESGVTVLNDEVADIIKKYEFGGVILFAENVKETEQTARLTHAIQSVAVENNFSPLLISVDQEGGIVTRLGTGTDLPGNMALGATQSRQDALLAGQVISSELDSLGINVDFAPSLDVNNNPKNPVIGLRSFSSDPTLVSELGSGYIEGLQTNNIAAAAKHFPGHGDTATDSHVGLPVVNKTYEDLLKTELPPFFEAASNGVDMLMTAHIQFPEIEKTTVVSKKDGSNIYLPATLSPEILTNIVRNKMNYDGIVITDAMNMSAIAENFGESESTILALGAGADIILMPTILRSNSDLSKLDTIIEDVVSAIENGQLSEDKINTSVERVLKLKEKRGILSLAENFPSVEKQVSLANKTVGSTENRKTERKISNDAITLYENNTNVLPITPKAGEHILFVTAAENQLPGTDFSIQRLRKENKLSEDFTYNIMFYDSKKTLDSFKDEIDKADYVVVYTNNISEASLSSTNYLTSTPQSIFDYSKEKNKKTVQVSTNKPYDATHFTNRDSVLITYGYKGMDPTEGGVEPVSAFGPNIPAAVEVLFGVTNSKYPTGKLPVDLPKIIDGQYDVNTIVNKVGYSSSDWLTIPTANFVVSKQSVKPGETITVALETIEGTNLDLTDSKIKATYDTSIFEQVDSTDDLFVLKVKNGVTPQSINDLITDVSIIDKYGREFSVESSNVPKVTIEQGSDVTEINWDMKAIETLKVGKTVDTKIKVSPNEAIVGSLTWTIQKNDIASVDANGVIKGLKAGLTKVTVKSESGIEKSFVLRVTQ